MWGKIDNLRELGPDSVRSQGVQRVQAKKRRRKRAAERRRVWGTRLASRETLRFKPRPSLPDLHPVHGQHPHTVHARDLLVGAEVGPVLARQVDGGVGA